MIEDESGEEGTEAQDETYVRDRASTNFKNSGSLHRFSMEQFKGMSYGDT